jgi:transcriptional regulator with XRE-family HTH domain
MKTLIISPMSLVFPPADLGLRPEPLPSDKDWETEFLPLLDNVRAKGLDNIFSVVERGDGVFMVCDGSRRAKACIMLCEEGHPDFQSITVQVQTLEEIDMLEKQVAGNATQKKTTGAQYIKALQKILIVKNYTTAQLAEVAGMSEGYVKELLKINNLPKVVGRMIEEGDLSLVNAIQLNKLPEELITDEVLAAAHSLPNNAFTTKVSETLNNYKKALRAAKDPEEAKVFKPNQKIVSKEALAKLLQQAETAYSIEPSEYNQGQLEMIKKVWSIDEESIAIQKAEYEKKLQQAEIEKEKRKAARDAKAVEEAVKTLQKHNINVEMPEIA